MINCHLVVVVEFSIYFLSRLQTDFIRFAVGAVRNAAASSTLRSPPRPPL